ncbi:MAG: DinB family protein [Flavobacteriales bacterium]
MTATSALRSAHPSLYEFTDAYYHRYFDMLGTTDMALALTQSRDRVVDVFTRFAHRADHRYAEGKWSVREVLQHIIDTELIFMYRSLRLARRDGTSMAGFNENEYIKTADIAGQSITELLAAFTALRNAHLTLMKGFASDGWDFKGQANGKPMTARALGYLMAAHPMHHCKVVEERYS